MEKARRMLSDVGLSQDYWAEVVDTTCYLVNKYLTSSLVNKTSYQTQDGKRSSIANIIVFGCDAFVYNPKEIRKKLDSKSKKCIFIRGKDGIKGYKLLNPTTRTAFYSRYVIFKENKSSSKNEEVKREKELEKLEFNWNDESHGSDWSTESKEEVELQTLVIKISGQVRKQPKRYSPIKFFTYFALYATKNDPKIVKQVINQIEGELQKDMEEEMESLRKNETWDVVTLPNERKHIGSKWGFKRNINAASQVDKLKD